MKNKIKEKIMDGVALIFRIVIAGTVGYTIGFILAWFLKNF